MTAADMRAPRTGERVSQRLFARYLDVTTAGEAASIPLVPMANSPVAWTEVGSAWPILSSC
jgi:hypothetical protein